MTGPVPARLVLKDAAATNERLQHENLGFLSEERGFVPHERPLSSLPGSHRLWDEMAEQLPELVRSLRLRETVEAMPVLAADAEELPDRCLLRASVVLSMLAHAHYYVETDPPATLPPAIAVPWDEVTRRLGRPARHLSFADLTYNWRYVDPAPRLQELRVENLAPLVPMVGNEDERRFLMTTVEAMAVTAPVVSSVVRLQEALVEGELGAARRELVAIIDAIHSMTSVTFAKVDPNRLSETYVDPVVWGKTVALFTTPFESGVPSSGGTGMPTFHLLDVLFGRPTYATKVGAESDLALRWFPVHWRAFLEAVGKIRVPDYVAKAGDRVLRGLFSEAHEAYAGGSGFLARHRTKVYGYLDLSLKSGRETTLGGFAGGFADRVWDRTDAELEAARRERYTAEPDQWHHAVIKEVRPLGRSAAHVVLDIAACGLRHQAGSRCAVLPENRRGLVERTLHALRARGDEVIALDRAWRAAVAVRPGYESARRLTLRTLLAFGRIRPVDRAVAKLLQSVAHDEWLAHVVERRAEDQWELWDLLEEINSRGFDPRQLWKAHPGERASICRVVPPDRPRLYSISNTMDEGGEIHLTVGRLRYDTEATDVSPRRAREGTASTFLSQERNRGGLLPIRLVPPMRFAPPADSTRPVVMFAAGTGLAPVRAVLRARSRRPGAGPAMLYFAARTQRDVHYGEELTRLVDAGVLDLHVALSAHRRIADVMLEPRNASRLRELIEQGAVLYVCGRAGFAVAVMDALTSIVGSREAIHRLLGEGRYRQEVYTTYRGAQHTAQRFLDASEVVLHNNDCDGYWTVIDGRVYDLTEFTAMHPGGAKILRSYAGMDATVAYRRVLHDRNPEVDSMLAMHQIGVVRRLNFGSSWAIAIAPPGLRVMTAKDIYRAWIGLLYTAVEIENAVANDYSVRHEPVTHEERQHVGESPFKTQLLFQAHQRCQRDYLATLTGRALEHLWSLTSAAHGSHHSIGRLPSALVTIRGGAAAGSAAQLNEELAAALRERRDLGWCIEACAGLETADKQLMRDIKLGLRAGVEVFEHFGRTTLVDGPAELLEAAVALPTALERYYASIGQLERRPR